MPHISSKFGPLSHSSSFYCALLDPSRLCISCVHLCSRHSKLLAFRRVDLQHALYFGLKHFASSWPCSWQCTHNLVNRASCCRCILSPHELYMPTVLDGHSRAEWPVALHVLHTRYGHVPLFWRCPDCAHSVQKFGQSFWTVRCESDPQSTTYGLYDAIIATMQFPLRFTQRPCLDLRCQALAYLVIKRPGGP